MLRSFRNILYNQYKTARESQLPLKCEIVSNNVPMEAEHLFTSKGLHGMLFILI